MSVSVMSSAAGGTLWLLSQEQWAWTLFDAGCWGYASVTINTLVPLVFKQDAPEDEQKYVSAIWANLVAAGLLCSSCVWINWRLRATRLAAVCAGVPLRHVTPSTEVNLVTGTLLAGIICPFFGAILDLYGWRKIAVFLTSVGMCICLSIFASVRSVTPQVPSPLI